MESNSKINSGQEADQEDGNSNNNGVKQKREQFASSLRREVRRDMINSKRYANPNQNQNALTKCDFSLSHLDNLPNKEFLTQKIIEWNALPSQPELITNFFVSIESPDLLEQHYGIIGLRRILSMGYNLPIQQVLDSNILFKILIMAQSPSQPHLQMEATWCLANLASGSTDQTYFLIQKNVINIFCELAKSPVFQIAEQAIWGLGNITGDCVEFRSLVVKTNAVGVLLEVFDSSTSLKMKEQIIWVFSNICRLRPENEPFNSGMSSIISKMILMFSDTSSAEVQDDCLFGFCKFAKAICIDLYANEKFLIKLLEFFASLVSKIEVNKHRISACQSVLGGLTSSSNTNTMMVVNAGFLRLISLIMSSKEQNLIREACWIVSNIAIGDDNQIRSILSEPGLFEKIIILSTNPNNEISKEAIWILCNMCLGKNYDNIKYLIDQGGILEIFKENLKMDTDSRKITLIFEALINLISFFDSYRDERNENPFVRTLIDNGIGGMIEELQAHKSEIIYVKALSILENYFDLEDAN
jgi:importin subunit alpha-1